MLYALVPYFGHIGSTALFVAAFCIILSMYGGGFATIPAYLRDMFGTFQVGAIHGRLLTAWSVAGVLGPVLVNYIRAYQIDNGVPKAQAYSVTMYIMCALLLRGLHLQFRDACGRCEISLQGSPRRGRRPAEAKHHEGSTRIGYGLWSEFRYCGERGKRLKML